MPPLPGDDLDDGKLAADEYPVAVQWRQGSGYRQLDLTNGKVTSTKEAVSGGVNPGKTPKETLRVIRKAKRPGRIRMFRMGAVNVTVSAGKINFDKSKRQNGFVDKKSRNGFVEKRRKTGFTR